MRAEPTYTLEEALRLILIELENDPDGREIIAEVLCEEVDLYTPTQKLIIGKTVQLLNLFD
jgi:hypothetical protein